MNLTDYIKALCALISNEGLDSKPDSDPRISGAIDLISTLTGFSVKDIREHHTAIEQLIASFGPES